MTDDRFKKLLKDRIGDLAHALGEDWTHQPSDHHSAFNPEYLVTGPNDTRFTITVSDERLYACGEFPPLPEGMHRDEIYTAHIERGRMGANPAKLDSPDTLAREIRRRLLPTQNAARDRFHQEVTKFRRTEHHRITAADYISQRVHDLSSPARSTHIMRTERFFDMHWRGQPRDTNSLYNHRSTPSARVQVDATETLENISIELSGLSREAARAALAAAISVTHTEVRTTR